MEKQRLDKIIASTGKWSRREVKALVRQGRVLVDGVPARSAEEKRLAAVFYAHFMHSAIRVEARSERRKYAADRL